MVPPAPPEPPTKDPVAVVAAAIDGLRGVRPAGAVPADDFHSQMDELRDQLDSAFEEVVTRVNRVELRLGAIRHTGEVQAANAKEASEVQNHIVMLLQNVSTALDHAIATSAEPLEPVAPAAVDLSPVDERLTEIDEGLTGHLIDARVRMEAGLEALYAQLDKLRGTPVAIDTSDLEDAANRGSLHNAADIANLRRDVSGLTEAVRLQDKGIGELHSTLEWIKERLLR